MGKDCLIVIPARYGSERFPGKVLHPLKGKPVLQWCYEAALRSGLGPVRIATEHPKVLEFARLIGADAVMTSPRCQSGTDRVHEAARGTRASFVLNFQGDEPFMPPSTLRRAFAALKADRGAHIGTAVSLAEKHEINNPNAVKAVLAGSGRALYFSRSPVPFHHPLSPLAGSAPYYKHCGFYIYRREALERFVKLRPSPLERLERLEQLRALENGMNIAAAVVPRLGPAIDVPSDIKAAERWLARRTRN